MADVCISCARQDASTACGFADAYQTAGFSVWWDDALRSGEAFAILPFVNMSGDPEPESCGDGVTPGRKHSGWTAP